MTSLLRKLATAILALTSLGLSATVAAQTSAGSITYGPGSNAVPTLGGSALIALAVLLAVVAFAVLRTQRRQGVNLVVALTAIAAMASGIGGIKLVSDARAEIPVLFEIELDSAGGGTEALTEGLNVAFNITGVPQKILSIQLSGDCTTTEELPEIPVAECDDNPATILASGGEDPDSACALFIDCGNLEE